MPQLENASRRAQLFMFLVPLSTLNKIECATNGDIQFKSHYLHCIDTVNIVGHRTNYASLSTETHISQVCFFPSSWWLKVIKITQEKVLRLVIG